ncbi:uncharacterized protein LOC114362007 isoform X2 [Ostrinia furnacalis]|uniref:uncharacterized protein LOC114362007 isoform X2 n=1 Tax=Ostrinia furnacalis TaxID=93504 RepID=UPI00103C7762|nr:uncharacterized protein LOC114362007 isoform X2 [Ostrinia furnacalis]
MSATQIYSEEISGDRDITQATAVASVAAVPARPDEGKLIGFSQRLTEALLHLRLDEFQKENVPLPGKKGNCKEFPEYRFGDVCNLEHRQHVAPDEATPNRTPQMRRPRLLRRHIDRAAVADATSELTRHPRHLRRRIARSIYV